MVATLNLGRLAVLAMALWLVLLIYTSTVLVNVHKSSKNAEETQSYDKSDKQKQSNDQRQGEDKVDDVSQQLAIALKDIEAMRRQNEELKALLLSPNATRFINRKSRIAAIRNDTYALHQPPSSLSNAVALNLNQQTLRRSVENGLVELWYAATAKLGKLKELMKENKKGAAEVQRLTDELTEQYRTVLADALKLSSAGGVEEQRRAALWNLTGIIQNRLTYLQNPPDCQNARKLVCHLNKGCGFGCQLHHVTYCLIVAYGTERTMVLDSRGWRYSQRGWDSIFLPVSRNCRNFSDDKSAETWKGEDVQSGVQAVSLPIIDGIHPRPPYLPLSFPEEFAERLLSLHGYPPVWWVGQFVWYLMRYQPQFARELSSMSSRLQFATPCVGVHVRRTDKVGSEAAFHALQEYMQFVEAWYRIEAVKNGTSYDYVTKRVYLATDEPSLFDQARKSFPKYTFIGDPQVASTAQLSSRYSDSSLRGVVADIHFLSRCDYLVCTFSSQVCRVAYELMQVLRGDAAARFHSLDDVYYFGGQEAHDQVATLPHQPTSASEISLEVGDVVGIAGNHWDGYSKGRNYRTGQTGLYPSYKVKEKWRIVKFPTYPQADRPRPHQGPP